MTPFDIGRLCQLLERLAVAMESIDTRLAEFSDHLAAIEMALKHGIDIMEQPGHE